MAALFRCPLWRRSLINSVLRASRPSSFQILPSPTLKKFQNKVLSTSTMAGEVEATEKSRESSAMRSTSAGSYSSNVHQRKIYIGNIFIGQSDKKGLQNIEGELFDYFSKFGEIERMDFPHNKFTKIPLGYGFVTFREVEAAQKVLADAESHTVYGQTLIVGPLKNKTTFLQEKRNLTVHVKNVLNSISKQAIEAHFSKFGNVDKVILAEKSRTDENLSSYYIMFSSMTGALKALEQPIQRIADQSADSQVLEFPRTKKIALETKKLVVKSVPADLTVEDLRDYFQQFGEVELVELLVNMHMVSSVEGGHNVCFVRLSSKQAVDKVVQEDNHIIKGSEVRVAKQRDLDVDLPDKGRHLKLSVRGVPSSGASVVMQYLETAFKIVPTGVFFDRRQVLSGKESPCIVRFSTQEDLETVLENPKVTFKGLPLHFRRLIWRK